MLSSYNFKYTFFLMALQSFFTIAFIAIVMVSGWRTCGCVADLAHVAVLVPIPMSAMSIS